MRRSVRVLDAATGCFGSFWQAGRDGDDACRRSTLVRGFPTADVQTSPARVPANRARPTRWPLVD